MGIKKSFGSFFKPRNVFSRLARIGGTAAGAYMGNPMMGYQAGDQLAGLWEKDSDGNGFENLFTRAKLPSESGGATNLFSRQTPRSGGVDFASILNLLKMSGRM